MMQWSLRVVLDTNVVFEGLTNRDGLCGVIVEAWRYSLIDVFVTDKLAYEYEEVLSRNLSAQRWLLIKGALGELLGQATYVDPFFSWRPSSPDKDDEMVIDCAMNANALLVTSNIRDFIFAHNHLGLQLMTPKQFVQYFLEN